jgi:hypothetical protein
MPLWSLFGLANNHIRQAVIKEAMRMHPGVGFPLERVISSPGAKLCDVDIPSGTIVSVNAWVIHQNQDIYGHDADVFRPERWLEVSSEQLKLMDRCFLSVSIIFPVLFHSKFADHAMLTAEKSSDMEREAVSGRTSRSWRWASLYLKSYASSTWSGRR